MSDISQIKIAAATYDLKSKKADAVATQNANINGNYSLAYLNSVGTGAANETIYQNIRFSSNISYNPVLHTLNIGKGTNHTININGALHLGTTIVDSNGIINEYESGLNLSSNTLTLGSTVIDEYGIHYNDFSESRLNLELHLLVLGTSVKFSANDSKLNLTANKGYQMDSGDLIANKVIIETDGNLGSSDQFLKADGSLDNNTYATISQLNELLTANDAMRYKGVLEGSSTGTYTPKAVQGDTYKVSVSGKINGVDVEVGDMLICTTDTDASTSSNLDTIKNNWNYVQANLSTLSKVAVTGSYDDLSNKPTIPNASNFVLKSGDVMTGALTTSYGDFRKGTVGLNIGKAHIGSINKASDVIVSNSDIRFSKYNVYDLNQLAGLTYDNSSKTIKLGIADGTHFLTNAAQNSGNILFPGIKSLVLENNSYLPQSLIFHNTPEGYNWTSEIASDYWGTQYNGTNGWTRGMYFISGRLDWDNFIFLKNNRTPLFKIDKDGGFVATGECTIYNNKVLHTGAQDLTDSEKNLTKINLGISEDLDIFETYSKGYVDLGLPSGTLWGTYNLGSSSPEEIGHYISIGNTKETSIYTLRSLNDYDSLTETNTKYYINENNQLSTEIIDLEDDAAYVNLGEFWRLPTFELVQELVNQCTISIKTINSTKVAQFTKNGKSILIPFGGCKVTTETLNTLGYEYNTVVNNFNTSCIIPTQTLVIQNNEVRSPILIISSNGSYIFTASKLFYGYTIRPVCTLKPTKLWKTLIPELSTVLYSPCVKYLYKKDVEIPSLPNSNSYNSYHLEVLNCTLLDNKWIAKAGAEITLKFSTLNSGYRIEGTNADNVIIFALKTFDFSSYTAKKLTVLNGVNLNTFDFTNLQKLVLPNLEHAKILLAHPYHSVSVPNLGVIEVPAALNGLALVELSTSDSLLGKLLAKGWKVINRL